MNLSPRTEITLSKSKFQIQSHENIVCLGSCFAGLIGKKLSHYKFPVLEQPFGTIFNPLTLHELIVSSAQEIKQHSFVHEGIALNYKLNSNPFAAANTELLNRQIDEVFTVFELAKKKSSWYVITLGTAFTYFLKENNSPVSNCHQLPANVFKKRLLTLKEVEKSLHHCIQHLSEKNENARFILTVSPVRHVKDELSQNSLSKSILRLAIANICNSYQQVSYFPAFELMLDDLRDYRFYKNDLIHPSDEAEAYIWSKFLSAHMNDNQFSMMKKIDEVHQGLAHKPRFPFSEGWQKFKKDLSDKIIILSRQADMSQERSAFEELP